MKTISENYLRPEGLTKSEKYGEKLHGLSSDVGFLVQIVQGILVHDCWLDRYGISMNEPQVVHSKTKSVDELLDMVFRLDERSILIPRSPEKRAIVCCVDYAKLLCSLLRYNGIPAQCRCGFAKYLAYEWYFEDHWICEYWDALQSRWVIVDAQIDPFQRNFLTLDFDPLDIPKDQFITAWEAWISCRNKENNPDRFWISVDPKLVGLDTLYWEWFVRWNLVRDFFALNNFEIIPFLDGVERGIDWSKWPILWKSDSFLNSDVYGLLGRIATLMLDPDANFHEIVRLRENEPLLKIPAGFPEL